MQHDLNHNIMNWLNSLFFGSGVPHSIFILTIAIAAGIYLSHRQVLFYNFV